MTGSTEVTLCALDVFYPWMLEPSTYMMWNGEMLNLGILTELNSEAVTHTCSQIRTISVHFMKENFKQLNCYKKTLKKPKKAKNKQKAHKKPQKTNQQRTHKNKQETPNKPQHQPKNSHLTEVRQWKGTFNTVIPSFGPQNIPKQINWEVTSMSTCPFRESISSIY